MGKSGCLVSRPASGHLGARRVLRGAAGESFSFHERVERSFELWIASRIPDRTASALLNAVQSATGGSGYSLTVADCAETSFPLREYSKR